MIETREQRHGAMNIVDFTNLAGYVEMKRFISRWAVFRGLIPAAAHREISQQRMGGRLPSDYAQNKRRRRRPLSSTPVSATKRVLIVNRALI